eukprot:CAMPEP_0119131356 /NCGR_PEP_ID=MMETSP1310-20130426/10097_1 /TAXON_ID=464262 /ORGANISM="Genus nov. species nov., Strain RCC2339" /LENGTH=173 /DNA_ID=CAMNT_0007121923 /DNA_START=125 /DNA_END=646 /DNA_ORIENTATION=+
MGKKQRRDSDDEFLDSLVQANQSSWSELVVYFVNALLVATVPVYLYVEVFGMACEQYQILYGIVTLATAYVLSYAYKNTAFNVKVELSKEREHLITNKAIQGKQTKEEVKEAQDLVTAREAIAYSLFSVSSYFLACVTLFAFFIFARAPAAYNYIFSLGSAAALWAVVSMGST